MYRRLDGSKNRTEEVKILPLPGLELRSLGRSACSQSIYWLNYDGSILCEVGTKYSIIIIIII
jgi:hypothetical protein